MKRLAHDLLDKQLISSDHEKVGRVDGIILELHERSAPRVVAVEVGMETVLQRVHGGQHWLRRIARRLGVPNEGAPAKIPFSKVESIDIEVRISLAADEAGTKDWEDWLRRNVIERIPWSGKGKEEKKK